MSPATPVNKCLVLVGAGHAHAQVLRAWAREPVPQVALVLVSPQALAPYSGMVPGWLAGAYRYDEAVIDFAALCAAAGARWVAGELAALDAARQRLTLDTGETLAWDLLSLNVGSTLHAPASTAQRTVLAMRPLSALQAGWDSVLRRWQADPCDRPLQLTTVGGGAAGFETVLAAATRLRALRADRPVHAELITRGAVLLPGVSALARRAALRALARAGVALRTGADWADAPDAEAKRPTELLLWAAGAQAHTWQTDPQRRGGLAVSAQGFIRVDAQLRSVSHPRVWAVGDCAAFEPPLPKAGVFAVRMGPVLWHNLRAALGAAPAQVYRPQRQHLVLLSTADGRAIASHGIFGAEGRWVWRWKDRIDRGFAGGFVGGLQPPP